MDRIFLSVLLSISQMYSEWLSYCQIVLENVFVVAGA